MRCGFIEESVKGIMKKWKLKKKVVLAGVAVTSLVMLTSCGSNRDKTLYQDVLERFEVALDEDWDVDMLQSADMSYMYVFDSNGEDEVGFCFYDLDQNGTSELLIGKVVPGDFYKGMIFDMYTVINEKIVSVLSSGERYRYYLCEDNRISLEASGGAGYSYYLFCDFDGGTGTLKPKEAIIYDSDYDRENPWFYTAGSLEKEDYTQTTEREAREIINSYVHKAFEVTPFSKD